MRSAWSANLNNLPVFTITPVGSDEAILVHLISVGAFREYEGALLPTSGALLESEADVAAEIDLGGAALAWSGEAPVGSILFRPVENWLYVGRLAVLPEFRFAGAGRLLLDHAEGVARSLGLPRMRVGVREALPGNRAFFERVGFSLVGEEPHPRHPASIRLILEKPVNQKP